MSDGGAEAGCREWRRHAGNTRSLVELNAGSINSRTRCGYPTLIHEFVNLLVGSDTIVHVHVLSLARGIAPTFEGPGEADFLSTVLGGLDVVTSSSYHG